jgi:tetratricopeptide (TPR) repeat protein
MRLAISIAAWFRDPDATFPPEEASLPHALNALGFSVIHAPLAELPTSFAAALSGLEPSDTLLVHIGGVLTDDGSLEVHDANPLSLSCVTEALVGKRCGPTLIVVEAAYRGEGDAFRAVELVEAVAEGLEADGAAYTTVIAAHPLDGAASKLGFTRLLLDSVADVVKPNGLALVNHAYARARERQVEGVAASGFALLQGDSPFYIAHSGPAGGAVPPAAVTQPEFEPVAAPPASDPPPAAPLPLVQRVERDATMPFELVAAPAAAPAATAAPAPPADRGSTRTFDLVDIASSRPGALAAAPSSALDKTSPNLPNAPSSPDGEALAETASTPAVAAPASSKRLVDAAQSSAPPTSEPATTPTAAPADPRVAAREALDGRISAATAAGDHRLAVTLCRERLALLPTVDARVDELFEIGRTLVAKLRDLPEAVVTLEEARGLDASRPDVLEALRRAYARLERWTETLEVTLSLIKKTEDAHERAGLRVAAALLARQALSDDDYALELLALALEDDPCDESALDETVRIRRGRGELRDLERSLAALAGKLVTLGHAARAWDVCQRLASVRRDDLGDTAGAVEALAIAKRLPLTELDSRAVLGEQLIAIGDDEGAIAEFEAIVQAAPLHLRAHSRLFAIHHRAGNHDRAYLMALVLEELGDADPTAREILEAQRSEWGLRARTTLDDRAWERLRAPGADDVIEGVFRATVRAAIAAQLEDRSRFVLDPSRRQPETSTASIIRCFHWAARALGTPCPALYLLDEVKGGIAAVSAPEPSTALGPQVTHGLSSRTLAFLAGRHLTYFRPEHQVLVHFPTAEAAAGLFFAAVEIVAPGTFVPPNLALRVASAKQRLARHLRADELSALSLAVGRLEAREAKVDLLRWIRSIELTAGRAGLLLAGDLQTAIAQVRSEPRGLSGLDVEERRIDLLSFCASPALAELRATYADTARSSMRPPSSESSAVVRRDDVRHAALREFEEEKSAPRLLA